MRALVVLYHLHLIVSALCCLPLMPHRVSARALDSPQHVSVCSFSSYLTSLISSVTRTRNNKRATTHNTHFSMAPQHHYARPAASGSLIIKLRVPRMSPHRLEDSSSSPAFEAAINRQSLRSRPKETPTNRSRTIRTLVSRKEFGKGSGVFGKARGPMETHMFAEREGAQGGTRQRLVKTPTGRSNPNPSHTSSTFDPGWYQLPLVSVWSEDDWKNGMSDGISASLQRVYEDLGLATPFTTAPSQRSSTTSPPLRHTSSARSAWKYSSTPRQTHDVPQLSSKT
jgi:hypothetical protein